MATSPNYAWSEPDNSSLVKNGAADIRTLGDAIDTSVWNVGYGQAGKNKIINGDFYWNQRNFTSGTAAGTYGFDRWSLAGATDGTSTMTAQTFTATTSPLDSYEQGNYVQVQTTGQTLATAVTTISSRIENVKTFAGQTVTVSFYAKATTGTPKIAVSLDQFFGSGGSSQVNNYIGSVTLSTSWARYSVTGTLPNVDSKTFPAVNTTSLNCTLWLSAGTNFDARTGSLGIQTNTFGIWGVQVEAGSTATPFQTATGTIQGELAACQRYYQRMTVTSSGSAFSIGMVDTTTSALIRIPYKVSMRTAPTALEQSGTASDYALRLPASVVVGCNSVVTFGNASTEEIIVGFPVASGLTAGQAVLGRAANANAYLGWSAEL